MYNKLKERLSLFDDNQELIKAALDITDKLRGTVPFDQLYILNELITNASGLQGLAESSIRAVKALELKQFDNEK